MVSRCANPDCSANFRYLRDGRLFHLHLKRNGRGQGELRLESFWLCGSCAPRLTVVAQADGTIALRDLAHEPTFAVG
jgi:hypothetical protein